MLTAPKILRSLTSQSLLLLASLAITSSIQAQAPAASELPQDAFSIDLDADIPISANVITGEFSNGIRYYIRENSEPANRAELRLVVDAGSILEDESQVGLAHFLEHMAFNGTKNFEKQELISFMESIGMRLGPGINASTSFDETIYKLQVPTQDPVNIQTAFQIMEDWTTGLTLDSEEIELERGVVIEEWRLGQGAQTRIRDKQIPILLKNSQYATRLPIGTLENLQNFKHDDLRRFYEDWYRPELMGVIAVGDFDAVEIERLIKQHFEHIPASPNPKERPRFFIPSHEETLFSITTDPEVPITQVSLYHKMPTEHDWTAGGYRQSIVEGLYNAMLSTRFQEMTRQANPPFLGAASQSSSLVRPLSAYMLAAIVQETGIERGLETLLLESERVAQHGFSEEELARQKTTIIRGLEQAYANRDSRNSSSHAAELIRVYLSGESSPGIAYELALYQRFIPGITLEEINQVGKQWIHPENRVVAITAPEKEGLTPPLAEDLLAVINSSSNTVVEAREEETNDKVLMANIPQGSAVISSTDVGGNITEWKLANGLKVLVKPTDFRQDEIVFQAISPGGTSMVDDEDFISAQTAVTLIANGGLGDFSSVELQRELTGKIANVSPMISAYQEGLQGGGSPADLETMMQLIYLRMTAPRADPTFYQIFQSQMQTVLQNRLSNPSTVFDDAFNRTLYQDHFRHQPPSVEMLEHTDLDKALAIYKERFADASDFTFIFVGNIDLESFKPLVETYLGALPSTNSKEQWIDRGVRFPTGIFKETIKRGLEPQSSTRVAFSGPFDILNRFERTHLQVATAILQTRLRNVMREELGGTYGVQVNRSMIWEPVDSYTLTIAFGSDPQRADELTEALFNEIATLKEAGPTEKEIADAQQALLRTYETGLESNGNWLAHIRYALYSGVDPLTSEIFTFPETLDAISVDSMRTAFNKFLDTNNYIQATLLPEN